ncbi:MAG: glucan 1,4-alpha-glucosidase [Firmicutes bacterium]|nr:glucan 1,4-alpha-glucosidase [Bacillota bacterium]
MSGEIIWRDTGKSAPGWPGARPTWASAKKVGIGTSAGMQSKVWFSLAHGAVTEVYYPALDKANTREMKFFITDGRTFLDDETKDTIQSVQLVHPLALAYRLINTDKEGKYRLVKTVITDPFRNSLLMKVNFMALEGRVDDYKLYLYTDPHVNNSGWCDVGYCGTYRGQELFLAGEGPIWMAVGSSAPWAKSSVGFCGRSDGLEDLHRSFGLQHTYDQAIDGNIAHIAQIEGRDEFTVVMGFGRDAQEAAQTALDTLRDDWHRLEMEYIREWNAYCTGLDRLDGKATQLYYVSGMVLKACEDKTHRGAMIASLSVPWGEASSDDNTGGYHLVWARDLYHVAQAFMAMGDRQAANRALDYLAHVQQRADGSFPQNSWLNGEPYWGGVQMDEVSVPIILAWELGRKDLYHGMVKKAADYIATHGPATPQERWEENGGYSPSTIAAEIAALVCAADLARQWGEHEDAERYLALADEWQSRVEEWCFTTTGWHGTGRHYIRIAPHGQPNCAHVVEVKNGGGLFDQRELVDAGFLELVRLGVKAPDDPYILESIKAVDEVIRRETPKGPAWYRYNHDGYGETADGGPYQGQGKGRLWTHLVGERGHYELARGQDPNPYLRTMEALANQGYMLAEQVWEETGEGTGGATPLAWAHAEYIRLLKSAHLGKVWDTPAIVKERYVGK